jgi:two-component system NarL family sensor kinase
LAALIHDWEAKSNLRVAFEAVGIRPLTARLEAGLYRIAQEALNNVVRHAQARQVAVQLIMTPDYVQLAIEDNGIGFDPARVPPDRHGLVGMRERARLLGGMLELDSDSDRGTRVQVIVPL